MIMKKMMNMIVKKKRKNEFLISLINYESLNIIYKDPIVLFIFNVLCFRETTELIICFFEVTSFIPFFHLILSKWTISLALTIISFLYYLVIPSLSLLFFFLIFSFNSQFQLLKFKFNIFLCLIEYLILS